MKAKVVSMLTALLLGQDALAQPLIQPVGKDKTYAASTTNPVPVEIAGSTAGTAARVNIVGKDGTNVHNATTNPVATQVIQSDAALGQTNGLPVRITNGASFNTLDTVSTVANPVGLKGKDGSTIHGAANPVAIELIRGGDLLTLFKLPSAITTASGAGNVTVRSAGSASDYLVGFSVRESAASPAAASFRLHNATSNTNPIIYGELAANASDTQWFSVHGIKIDQGLYLERLGGETEFTFFYVSY